MKPSNKLVGLSLWKYAPVLAIILLLVYLLPLLTKAGSLFSENFKISANGYDTTFLRSLIFAVTSSSLCIIISLRIAFFLSNIEASSKAGKSLSLLIVPFLIGNTSTAFIFKIILLRSPLMDWAYQSPLNLFLILLIIQLWQFGTLFVYLFWLSFKSIQNRFGQYFAAFRLTRFEYFKEICLPHSRNLIILLTFICFIFSFYEDVKISLIFRVSEGLDSEMISHWIYRNFHSDLLIGYKYAIQNTNHFSLVTMLGLSLSFLIFGILFAFLIGRPQKKISFFTKRQKWNYQFSKISIVYFIPPIIVAIPLLSAFVFNDIHFEQISPLFSSLILCIVGGSLATICAIFFSFSARLINFNKMGSFNSFSYLFLFLLFVILLLPPIEIMISGYQWIHLLNLSESFSYIFFWLLGHIILSLPLLGGFLIVTHFQVTPNELNYCYVHNVRRNELFRLNFLKKFRTEYFLAFLFAFTLILNEGLLNKVFSDRIPSFISALNESISSKNADYSLSMLYYFLSLIIALLCITVWIRSMKKNTNEKNTI